MVTCTVQTPTRVSACLHHTTCSGQAERLTSQESRLGMVNGYRQWYWSWWSSEQRLSTLRRTWSRLIVHAYDRQTVKINNVDNKKFISCISVNTVYRVIHIRAISSSLTKFLNTQIWIVQCLVLKVYNYIVLWCTCIVWKLIRNLKTKILRNSWFQSIISSWLME